MIDKKYTIAKSKKLQGREGEGYTAVLLKNGKEVGCVTDYADGGETRVDLVMAEKQEFNAYAKDTLESLGADVDQGYVNIFVNHLYSIHLARKSAKRSKKSTIVFHVADCEYYKKTLLVSKWNAPYNKRVKEHLETEYDGIQYEVLSEFID